jgi:hypothetical protein
MQPGPWGQIVWTVSPEDQPPWIVSLGTSLPRQLHSREQTAWTAPPGDQVSWELSQRSAKTEAALPGARPDVHLEPLASPL